METLRCRLPQFSRLLTRTSALYLRLGSATYQSERMPRPSKPQKSAQPELLSKVAHIASENQKFVARMLARLILCTALSLMLSSLVAEQSAEPVSTLIQDIFSKGVPHAGYL